MIEIEPTEAERAQRCLAPATLAWATQALVHDGVVLLKQVADHADLDVLEARMAEDTRELLAFVDRYGGNPRAQGHLQQGPPPFAPYVFESVVMNPFANQVGVAMLGADARLTFYNGNTNCPGSCQQELHMDSGHLFPNWEIATPAWSLVVNVPTDDCTTDNGAVELWPGSHTVPMAATRIDPGTEAARRGLAPPVRGVSIKGDIMIRDTRLWHRGVPNLSDKPRQMIALIHTVGWKQGARLVFGDGSDRVLEGHVIDANATYTSDQIDYLLAPSRAIFERRGTPTH